MKYSCGYFGDYKKEAVYNIEYAAGLYNQQKHEVEKAKYMEDLLLKNYVQKIKEYHTNWDMRIPIIEGAQKYLCNKNLSKEDKKSAKNDFETLQILMQNNFFNQSEDFNIVEILQCGMEGHGYSVTIEGLGEKFYIKIPSKNEINTRNIEYADYGKFTVSCKKSDISSTQLVTSYFEEDIANAIKEYLAKQGKEI